MLVRNVERLIGNNPSGAAIEEIRDEIAGLRQSVSSNNVDQAVDAIRTGYEGILHRLEDLQSSVGDPRLYHSIADRLGEVRKALRAIPQVEYASGIERRIEGLADRVENVRSQIGSLPFATLQDQVDELQNAMQSISPKEAIKELEWKLRALGDKLDTLEGSISRTDAVTERVSSLEDLIRSQPAPVEVVDRLDRLQNLFLDRTTTDSLQELETRIDEIGRKIDRTDDNDTVGEVLTALDRLQNLFLERNGTDALRDLETRVEEIGRKIERTDGNDGLSEVRTSLDRLQNLFVERSGTDALLDLKDRVEEIAHKIERPDESHHLDDVRSSLDRLQTLFVEKNGSDVLHHLQNRIEDIAGKIDRAADGDNPTEVLSALDRLQTLFMERSGTDALDDLTQRVDEIARKIDHAEDGDNVSEILTGLDVRLAELCVRFESFSDQFDSFADSQSTDTVSPQIEAIAERIESLAEAVSDGRSVEPVRRDIADLRMQLADGDRAVVDLADRIGRIGDRLERFQAFDSEDGKLARLSDDLVVLQKQIADGDTVVFEILKRVGGLEDRLERAAEHGSEREHDLIAAEITEIRERLASGDDMLGKVVDRMDQLLSSVDTVAREPGLLAELAPVQKDFAALQKELSDGNEVARNVLAGLTAIDEKLENLPLGPAENADITRLSNEIVTLRQVVEAADNASLSSLNSQIGNLAARLDQVPLDGGDGAVLDGLEDQVEKLAAKLVATEDQLGNLSQITDRLDRIDERLQESGRLMSEVANAPARLAAADDPSVIALQGDLKRLQDTAARTDDSFGAVQEALTGIAERLSSLESGRAPQTPSVPAQSASLDTDAQVPEVGVPTPRVPTDQGDVAPGADDHRPLEPGSGKPKARARPRFKTAAAPEAAAMRRTPPEKDGAKPGTNRAEFLEAARRAARQAASEAGTQQAVESSEQKKGWLSRAAALRNRKSGVKDEPPVRHTPEVTQDQETADRVSVLDEDAAAASLEDKQPGFLKRHARTLLAGALGIAIVLAGVQAFRIFMNGGADVASVAEQTPVAEAPAAQPPVSSEPDAQTEAAPQSGGNSQSDPAFAPPSGVESRFDNQPGAEESASTFDNGPRQIVTQPVAGQQTLSYTSPPETAIASVTATEEPETAAPAPASPAVRSLAPTSDLPEESVGPLALREAAASGDVFAQFEIASRYMEGRGTKQDLPKAVDWYAKAAAQDFAPAQYRLGSMYEKGLGTAKDLQSARSWYTRAADKGNAKAIHNLAVLHAEGGLGERNFERAAQWFKQSADYGVTDSQYNLGILYAQGLGVDPNLNESYKWFALAAKAGDADAGRKRDAVAAELSDEQKSRALITVSAWKPKALEPKTNTVPPLPAEWQGAPQTAKVITRQEMIAKIQALLTQRGYNPGSADGKMGPQTKNAIRAFQKDAGLPVTGEVDTSLLSALHQT